MSIYAIKQRSPEAGYAKAAQEDRSAPRYHMAIPCLLQFGDGEMLAVDITNISMSGFACDVPRYTPIAGRCQIKIPGFPMMETEAVRRDKTVLGCAFMNLLDPQMLDELVELYKVED